jgi:hypothetical protein
MNKTHSPSAIRPFKATIPDDALARLRAKRWREGETVPDPSQGVQLATRVPPGGSHGHAH